MSVRPTIPLILGSLALLLAFQNCAKSNLEGQGYELPSTAPPLGAPLGAEGQCDPPSTKVASGKVTGPLDSTVAAGTRMAVMIDRLCYESQGNLHPVSGRLRAEGVVANNASAFAVSYALERAQSPTQLQQLMDSDPCVMRAEKDIEFTLSALPDDPYYSTSAGTATQSYLKTIAHDKIVERLYNNANGITQTVRVAVIDSGMDVNHPDLINMIMRDSNGQLMVLNALDNSRDVIDSGFHGTHVAGLIAAEANNGKGITGVIGRNVKIMPIKTSANGTNINLSAVANGLRWAADNGATVINMSLGGKHDTPPLFLKEAIQYAVDKGAFVVVAAGNDGSALSPSHAIYPAMFSKDIDGMITVGSFDVVSQGRSSFSNVSTTYVDLMAPGSNGSYGILSTVPANLSSSGYANKVNNGPIHGTSMASPVAAGSAAVIMALARSRGYSALPTQVEKMFEVGSVSVAAFSALVRGGRKLDLQKLVQATDADMGLSITQDSDRSLAKGTVGISSHPQSQTVQAGAAFTLSVQTNTSSSVFVNYQWTRNNIKLLGATGPVLNIPAANSSHQGVYKAEITAGTNKTVSQGATITVSGCQ